MGFKNEVRENLLLLLGLKVTFARAPPVGMAAMSPIETVRCAGPHGRGRSRVGEKGAPWNESEPGQSSNIPFCASLVASLSKSLH